MDEVFGSRPNGDAVAISFSKGRNNMVAVTPVLEEESEKKTKK